MVEKSYSENELRDNKEHKSIQLRGIENTAIDPILEAIRSNVKDGNIDLTKTTSHAILRAINIATELNHSVVGVEHVLVAFAADSNTRRAYTDIYYRCDVSYVVQSMP